MRISVIASSVTGGGMEHVARKHIEAFMGVPDYEVSLITCDPAYPGDDALPLCNMNCWSRAHPLDSWQTFFGWDTNENKAYAFLFQKQPELIHVHNYLPFGPGLMKALHRYKRQSGCRIVLTHHNFSYLCTNDAFYNFSQQSVCEKCLGKYSCEIITQNCTGKHVASFAKYIQKKMIQRSLHSIVDQHIAPSQFMKRKLLKMNPKMQVTVVPNSCLETVQEHNVHPRKEIVYFGRISKEKNVLGFAQAFSKAKTEYTLKIIGTGPEEDRLSDFLSTHGHSIIFINRFLPTQKLYHEIRESRYFILPSVWYENSPVSIVEAVNWGLIPLVSSIGGMRELCSDLGVGIQFDPMDEQNIQRCLMQLEKEYEQQERLLKSGRQQLRAYTTTAYKKSMEDIYASVVDQ